MSPQGLAPNPVRGNSLLTNPDQSVCQQRGEFAVSIRCCLPSLLRDLVTGAEQLVCEQSLRTRANRAPAPSPGGARRVRAVVPTTSPTSPAQLYITPGRLPASRARAAASHSAETAWVSGGRGGMATTAPSCSRSQVLAPRLSVLWQLLPVFRQQQPLRMPSCAAGTGLLMTRTGAGLPSRSCGPEPFA